jgi:CheY-like chemotaxis protein
MTYQRFILIDDNEADNVYHEIMIRRAGFEGEILVFESGIDALVFFQKDPLSAPTCIFLDINMPLMDGFEMAEQATPLLIDKPSVMLLMLTSSGSPADRERAGTLPVIKGYVIKPLDVATVQKLMSAGA